MTDPYTILGLNKGVSDDQVKSAFKKLAMKHHPDKGGDPDKFKEINDAFGRIVKPEQFQPQQHNNGFPFQEDEINSFARQFFGGSRGGFSFFNQRAGGGGPARPVRQMIEIRLSLEDLYKGKRFNINNVEVNLPPGTPIHKEIPVPNTNLVIIVKHQKHDTFDVENGSYNLIYRQNISLCESLLGFKGKVRHPNGETLILSTPKHKVIRNDEVLRVKGKGIPVVKGGYSDLVVVFDVTIPNTFDYEKYAPVIKEMFGWDVPDIIPSATDVQVTLV